MPNINRNLLAVLLWGIITSLSGCHRGQIVKGNEFTKVIDEESVQRDLVQVTGLGASDPAIANAPQKQALCQQAAQVDAQRKLAEIIKGFTIEGNITVSQAIEKDSLLVSKVNASVAGATVDNTQFTLDNNGCSVHMSISKKRINSMMGIKFQ